MAEKKITGVYISCLNGHATEVDMTDLTAYVKNIPDVQIVWNYKDISLTNRADIVGKIMENKLDKILIAGFTPGKVKNYFSEAMTEAGNNPEDVFLASFNEIASVGLINTDRAKAVIACAITGLTYEQVAVPEEVPLNTDTLVIGAGIAGIQASLEIADSGNKVFLVERTATIGGHMAMFDKTFPTLDCAACILTPKMVEVGQHPNIEMMTYCEVLSVSGEPGNYKITVLKKARRVDLATCIGCGMCAEKCPATAASEFDSNTTLRKAIYIPFPQAVPNKYLIDATHCTYVKNGKCGVCVKICPVPNCINLDEKDKKIEITVGNIIVATGFKTFDPIRDDRFGYGKFPNVLTSLEFERLVNAAGPTGGNIVCSSTDKKGNRVFAQGTEIPSSIAVIHCVGSRDENFNKYCSKVCCMYSLKLSHLIKEKLPDAEVYEYYIDMRAFGKGYEEFYERIKEEHVNIIRGRTAQVEEKKGKLILRSEDIMLSKLIEQEVDMVVLSVGLEPREDAELVSKMLGISQSEDGWFIEENYISNPVNTTTGGISIAGLCQGPKDIPDTVAQASAAASRVIQSIIKGKVKKNAKDFTLADIESKLK